MQRNVRAVPGKRPALKLLQPTEELIINSATAYSITFA